MISISRRVMSVVLSVVGAGALALAATGCAASSDDDASAGADALSGDQACRTLDLETPGSSLPRGRLMAAVHADFATVLADVESQGTEIVARSIVQNERGVITLTARLQSKKGGRPIDWDRTSFPADFKASARQAGGFEFTLVFQTTDCGRTFRPIAELSIAGLSDERVGAPVASITTGTYALRNDQGPPA